MKFKSKLIPIFSLVGATSIVMPIALTGCSNQLIGNTFDLTNGYTPRYDRLEQGVMTTKQMVNTYCDHLMKKPLAFVDDLFWSKANIGTGFEPFVYLLYNYIRSLHLSDAEINAAPSLIDSRFGSSSTIYQYENITVSNLKIVKDTIEISGGQYIDIPLISCKISFDSSIKSIKVADYLPGLGNDTIGGKLHGSLAFESVPFVVASRYMSFPFYHTDILINVARPFVEWMAGETLFPRVGRFEINLNIQNDLYVSSSDTETQIYSFSRETSATDGSFAESEIYNEPILLNLVASCISTPLYFQRIVCSDQPMNQNKEQNYENKK